MLFFEYSFVFVFLPVTLALYFALPARGRNTWLLVASCAFYAVSSFVFLPVLWLSVLVDWAAGRGIAGTADPARRKRWLCLSLVVNLGALASFKYIGLVTATLQPLLGLPLVQAALPVGISFYTFQSMSYTIDLYRGRIAPVRTLRDFGAYVTMFPQLIAGPIVRFSQISEQLYERTVSAERFASGLQRMIVGMAKKLLVADTLALLAAPLFASASPGFADAWVAMLLFAGQIYFDFSAYSDMAIGLGRLLGFELPENFRSPYKATSFADFWHRWHVTLSTWLRDYLYIPLGGNRRGSLRTYANLLVTMLLGGLWHGASWNFLLWGGAHGALLAGERLWSARGWPAPPRALRPLGVFLAVTLCWVPFRFEHAGQTLAWLGAMLVGSGGTGSVGDAQLLGVAALLALIWLPRNTGEWRIRFAPAQLAFAALLLALTLLVGYGRVESSPFLYFRF